jgi:predicted Zn-dependent peptidase
MSSQLKKGVTLTVIPTEKFKTVHVLVRFVENLKAENTSKRALISSLIETNSRKYPEQTDISEKLADMYGASFNAYVSRKGNHHWLNILMGMVNDKYLTDSHVLEEAVVFLNEILFHPNVDATGFNEETFKREKENMKQYIESAKEDTSYYAGMEIAKLFFNGSPAQGMPSFGTVESLAEVERYELMKYYKEVLTSNLVEIIVLGDVTEEEVAPLFAKLPFTDRLTDLGSIFYTQPKSNIIQEKTEREELAQSKLNLAYALPVRFDSPQYFALQVFNGLFGGFSHSKLFMNVREKESMAYYASSSFDSYRGMLTVQTGIDAKNREKVVHLIHKQLDEIKLGHITEEELQQTKNMLKNSYRLSLDSAGALLEREFIDHILPRTKHTKEEWLAAFDAVTEAQVIEIAESLALQAVFFLEGTLGIEEGDVEND